MRNDLNPFDIDITFTIGFNEIVSSNRIEMFGIEKRNCKFSSEITSKHSYPLGNYTQNFCLMDCGIKAAIKLCGCQPFFYSIGNKNQPSITLNFLNFNFIFRLNKISARQWTNVQCQRIVCFTLKFSFFPKKIQFQLDVFYVEIV